MSHERDEVQQAMEDEARQIVREAKSRPITADEELLILWHMGLPLREERRV